MRLTPPSPPPCVSLSKALMMVTSISVVAISHYKTRWPCLCGHLLMFLVLLAVPLCAVQLTVTSFPTAISTCCCYPDQCPFNIVDAAKNGKIALMSLNITACDALKQSTCGESECWGRA